jgi:hypothetical protein
MMNEKERLRIFRLKDPKELQKKQFLRDMGIDSTINVFWVSCIICPIVFAIAWMNPAHLLQIAYFPLGFFIAPIVFNYKPLGNWYLNLLYFRPAVSLLLFVALIFKIVPTPYWYIGVVGLQLCVFWYVRRRLPMIKLQEWQEFSRNTGMSNKEIDEALKNKT